MAINPALIAGIPKIVSAKTEETLKINAVYANLANRNYEGEVSNYGDEVTITTPGALSTREYTGADLTYDDMSLADQKLKIDQKRYFGFQLDYVDEKFLKPNVLQPYLREGTYAISQYIEQFYAGKYTDALAANTITEAELSSANVISTILAAKERLKTNNYSGPIWCVIPSWFDTKINLADITFNTNNAPTMTNGWMGRFLGIDFYESNNTVTTGSAGSYNSKILMGTPNTFTHAQALAMSRAKEAEKAYKMLVDGLVVFGGKTVRTDQLVLIDATETAETSI